MYEDVAIADTNRMQSDIVPTLNLTAAQLFAMDSQI